MCTQMYSHNSELANLFHGLGHAHSPLPLVMVLGGDHSAKLVTRWRWGSPLFFVHCNELVQNLASFATMDFKPHPHRLGNSIVHHKIGTGNVLNQQWNQIIRQ